ncbi:hypothetical protein [Mesorhizobium xinjiangense]|uniref:hypothetical protein n=1 Tax=Mesorhizobium xinjiangense TaxID=2678685 RepID=UPI0012ED3ADB|nr:hypothetical protein [Mesorhizobium xinjiangense]
MTFKLSIERLRRLCAQSDSAFATAREAREALRNATANLHAVEAKLGRSSDDGGVYFGEDWDRVPRKDWPKEYAEAREAVEAAKADLAHHSGVVGLVGGHKRRAIEYCREHGIRLPADLERVF